MRRRTWITLIAIPLLLLAADLAYWRIAADRLRDGYGAWAARLTNAGWSVAAGSPSIGGWPAAASVTVPNLTLRHGGPDIPGDVDIAAASVILSVSLIDPAFLTVSPSGPLHVRAGSGQDIIVTGDKTAMAIPLLGSLGPMSVALHASSVRLEAATGAWHVTIGLVNARLDADTAPDAGEADPTATFSLNAEAIALPAGIRSPLGSNISSLALDGALNGKSPAARDLTRWAQAWRDDGGSLEVKHLAVGWGPLGISGSATLALDDQLQPMGSGSARVIGYAPTLDRLAAGGMLTKSAATAAKAVLSLMAGTTDADEPSAVDVPLTLQYRTLSMRQVPLVRFPELDWPPR